MDGFRTIEPKILYFGTPVALVSSQNEDGGTNLALSGERLNQLGGGVAAEVEVLRLHVAQEFVLGENHIDPEKWSPLIYNFRHYFRLADKELGKTFRAER